MAVHGYIKTAYKLLQDSSPGWLYAVKKGANTIWETGDGIKEDNTVSASLNHYSYGVISGWLLKGVCGITLSGNQLTITPKPYPLLEHARAEYDSPAGRIISGWRYEKDKLGFVLLTVKCPIDKNIYSEHQKIVGYFVM